MGVRETAFFPVAGAIPKNLDETGARRAAGIRHSDMCSQTIPKGDGGQRSAYLLGHEGDYLIETQLPIFGQHRALLTMIISLKPHLRVRATVPDYVADCCGIPNSIEL